MVESRHKQIINQVEQKFVSLKNSINSDDEMIQFFNEIRHETFDLVTPQEALLMHLTDTNHPKLLQEQPQEVRQNQNDRVGFQRSIDFIKQIQIKYDLEYSNTDQYLQELQSNIDDCQTKIQQLHDKFQPGSNTQIPQQHFDQTQQFYQSMIDFNKTNLDSLIKSIDNEFLSNSMKNVQDILQNTLSKAFIKDHTVFKVDGNVFFGPKNLVLFKQENKLAIGCLTTKSITKKFDQSIVEAIKCIAFSDEYICICFETTIWIVKVQSFEKVIEIPASAQPTSVIHYQQVFIVGSIKNNKYDEKIIWIDNHFQYNDVSHWNGYSNHQFTMRKNKNSIFWCLIHPQPYYHIMQMQLDVNQKRLVEQTRVCATHLKGTPFILGEVSDDQLLYYDFAEQTFKLWQISVKNSVKPVKIQGLINDNEKIVYLALHPDYMNDSCNWMIVLDDKNQVSVRKVQLIPDKKMSLDTLRKRDDYEPVWNIVKTNGNDHSIHVHSVLKDNSVGSTTIKTKSFSDKTLQQLV